MYTILGLLAIVLWDMLGLLGSMTKAIPALQLLAMCFTISALIVIIKRIFKQEALFKLPQLTKQQWLIGVTGLFGFHFCYFLAVKFAPIIEVSLIVYCWPLLLALFVAPKQRIKLALIGGVLGFAGIAFIIVGEGDLHLSSDYALGYSLAVTCALIWSSYSWFLTRSDSHVEDIAWQSAAVAGLALLASYTFESPVWQFTTSEWFGILLLGLGPVGGSFYLWDLGLKQGNKQLLASFSFSAPLISSILLALAGISVWSFNIVIALSLILTGAGIANFTPKSQANTVQNTNADMANKR